MNEKYLILCVNCGSTSTKLALFNRETKLDETNIEHSAEEVMSYGGIVPQLPMRMQAVLDYLCAHEIKPAQVNAIAVRGGPTGKRYHAGAYKIDEDMVAACQGKAVHPMVLGPLIAYEWVKEYGIPAFNYDVVSSDEMDDIARISALPEYPRKAGCHVLNTKAMARLVAEENGMKYEDVNYIVAHLGGGCSVSFHDHGRIADMTVNGEGTFSPSRAGRMMRSSLMDLVYSGKYTRKEVNELLGNGSGLVAHLGTNDCRVAEKMASGNNGHAKLVYDAFAYNIAKDIGTLSVIRGGKVDGIILTGGCAHSTMLTEKIKSYVDFIAPVYIKPGAIEMEALASGILRVVNGQESYHTFAEKY